MSATGREELKIFLSTIRERFLSVRKNKKLLLLVLSLVVAVALSSVSLAFMIRAYQSARTIPTSGEIKVFGVGIYWDDTCNDRVTALDWGLAEPGLTTNKTIYIRNEGNAPAILNLNATNWDPAEAADHITLNWDYNGETIAINQVVQVTLTLSISPDIEGIITFAFDITIFVS